MKPAVLCTVLLGMCCQPVARASSWPMWDHYAARFLTPQGRVSDPARNSMTTSEGQSYAMFFALVAGDRGSFDRIQAWTQDNLAQGDLARNLPAWSWGEKPDGSWGVLDENSASDSDLWVAYSLIEAGDLWGKPAYARTGKALLSLIAKNESAQLPQIGAVLLPGRNGFHSDSTHWVLNPSYMPLPLLLAAMHVDPQGPWNSMASALPRWLQEASPSGFAMDWVEYTDGKGFSAVSEPGKASKPAGGSYDAIRVYLWAGTTAQPSPGAANLIHLFAPMSGYVKAHQSPPEIVNPDGTVSSASAPPGFSAAMVPFLTAEGEKNAASQQLRNVLAQIEPSTGLLGDPPNYYDQNLALFALGWEEQRFRFAPDGTLRVQWKK
jgi:endo-1,4-beta-D-glucanase Y